MDLIYLKILSTELLTYKTNNHLIMEFTTNLNVY